MVIAASVSTSLDEFHQGNARIDIRNGQSRLIVTLKNRGGEVAFTQHPRALRVRLHKRSEIEGPLIDEREIDEEYLVFGVLTFDRPEIRTLGDPDVCDHLFDLDWMDREVTIWAHRTDVYKTISRRVQNWIAFHIPETGNQNNAGGRGAHRS
ncbi:hypothetical protein N7541_006255 [Penicillium brevicompactum]|uniref:Uncharacterized protein n=1 Tax=Penicillium brevicompactum TaxID=5074 RepID=A0A9W9R524_PENBR|nr:hypothetical protein N7541_006255 [Penicillium brevicompactum]